MTSDLLSLSWPQSDLGQAITSLARASGLLRVPGNLGDPPPELGDDPGALHRWIDAAAHSVGLEAEAVHTPYPEVMDLVRGSGPSVLLVGGEGRRFLAILRGGRSTVVLLGPDLEEHPVSAASVRDLVCESLEAPLRPTVEATLKRAGVSPARWDRARVGLLAERLAGRYVGRCWLLRHPPGSSFWAQLCRARVPHRFATMVGAHVAQFAILVGSWWLLGRSALSGRLDGSLLALWALMLTTMIPLRLLSTWAGGMVAIQAGGVLKRRLLSGALNLPSEKTRKEGVGHLLGRVMESEAVEALAGSGGFLALVAALDLGLAALVLSRGAGGAFSVLALGAWFAVTLYLAVRALRQRRTWTEARLHVTHGLVEKMVGHRTRLAQQELQRWHQDEDQALHRYHTASRQMDGTMALLSSAPRGWIVLGLATLLPSFVLGSTSSVELAIGIGGVLLALQAFQPLADNLAHVISLVVAWDQVSPLFHAASIPETAPPADLASRELPDAVPGSVLLEARKLVFRYPGRPSSVLDDCDLTVAARERILLTGASGGGKSTLGAVLAGLRSPDSGLLLVDGLDWETLGAQGWRRRVVTAPQFHENHVLAETLGFNLLMGRGWPPSPEDLRLATQVCDELGLTEVIERMPSGMEQMVGETGWQLSHGERSRLYVARALLQEAEVVILDESFAALDPATFRRTLACVNQRAGTLLVVAHP